MVVRNALAARLPSAGSVPPAPSGVPAMHAVEDEPPARRSEYGDADSMYSDSDY